MEDLLNRIKRNDYFFYSYFCFLVILIGGVLNMHVMDINDCKMPVLTEYPERYPTACYFAIENTQDANSGYLADIIKVRTKRIIHYFSIGDVLLYLGLSCFTILTIIKIYQLQKLKKFIKTN